MIMTKTTLIMMQTMLMIMVKTKRMLKVMTMMLTWMKTMEKVDEYINHVGNGSAADEKDNDHKYEDNNDGDDDDINDDNFYDTTNKRVKESISMEYSCWGRNKKTFSVYGRLKHLHQMYIK